MARKVLNTPPLDFLDKYRQLFEGEALDLEVFRGQPSDLYAPTEYVMSSGGKHLRPCLVYWVYDMYRSMGSNAHALALAIETFHNFTLVHDDIMDEAMVRRGKDSVYKRWGRDLAILSGDLMHIQALESLSRIDHPRFQEILAKFLFVGGRVCEGQQLDMLFEGRSHVEWHEYEDMIQGKTSVLLALCCELAAIIADTSQEEQVLWWQFGLNLGQAFQIQDDYLDAFGDATKTGKKVGGDIEEAKKSAPYVLLMEKLSDDVKVDFSKLYGSRSNAKVEQVLEWFNRYKVDDMVQSKLHDKIQICQESAQKLSVFEDNKESFEAMIHMVTKRLW